MAKQKPKLIKLTREECRSMDLQPPCHCCKHLLSYGTQRRDEDPMNSLRGWTCKAFPEEIPSDILLREVPHTEPAWNQTNNLVYRSIICKKKAGLAKMSWDGYWVEADTGEVITYGWRPTPVK
jgi:hypothetical protein